MIRRPSSIVRAIDREHTGTLRRRFLLHCALLLAAAAALAVLVRHQASLRRTGLPPNAQLRASTLAPAERERLVRRLEQASARDRAEIARSIETRGKSAGGCVLAAYPQLSPIGKLQALRLAHDHDRESLHGRWRTLLEDPSPVVVSFVLDLLAESGRTEDAASLGPGPPGEPVWLVKKRETTRRLLLARATSARREERP